MRAIAVEGIQNIAPFIAASHYRRTDMKLLADSNGVIDGITGHLEGMMLGMAGKLGLYASALMAPANSLYGSGAAGHGLSTAYAVAGEPSEFTALRFPSTSAVDGSSVPWGNVDWCGTLPGNLNAGGISLNSRCPVDMNAKLVFSSIIWRPPSGGITVMRPSLHGITGAGPGQNILSGNKVVNCPARSADGIDEVECVWERGEIIDFNNQVNAANSDTNYDGGGFKFRHRVWTGDATGIDGTNVFGLIGSRVIDGEKFRGSALTPLYFFGSQTMRAVALDLCGIAGSGGVSDAALAARLKAACKSQKNRYSVQLPPMLMVQLLLGGNDAGSSAASILSLTGEYRSGVAQSQTTDTRIGYFNNTVTAIRRIKYVWKYVLNYNPDNLFFLLGCYHPQSVGVSPAQWVFCRTTMVDAMRDVLNVEKNVAFVDGYKIATVAEMGASKGTTTVTGVTVRQYNQINATGTQQNNSWFRVAASEHAHLHQQGYLAWGQRVWDAIIDAFFEAGGFNPLTGGSSSEIQRAA